MIILPLAIIFISLFLGIPMMVGMMLGVVATMLAYFSSMDPAMVTQQLMTGVQSYVLLAIPMFILAAEIMCAGEAADRLLALVRSFVGHVKGGLAITASGTCTIFGAISGSSQATLVAIGRPMLKEMLKAGYSMPHALGLLMGSSNIALLIPPSICMIMYCVVSGSSVADLFIAGIGPGIFMFLIYAIYEYSIANSRGIILQKKSTWSERGIAIKKAILPLGFPIIILGGIYTGTFSPTEAAAMAVLYAFILEKFIFRSIKWADLPKLALSTGVVTATVFILIAAGAMFSFLLSYAGVPQALATQIIGLTKSPHIILLIISAFFLVTCMFVDSIPVILILTPIFYPITQSVGIDPIHLGIVITIQAAIGAITPPFGANVFTATAIFDVPFMTVIKGLFPYVAMFIATATLLVFFPSLALALV